RLAVQQPAHASPTAIPAVRRIPARWPAWRARRRQPAQARRISFPKALASHSLIAECTRGATAQLNRRSISLFTFHFFSESRSACKPSAKPMARLIFVGDRLQLLEPCGRFAVRGRPIVAARRQRSARTDLGRVGDTTALELAQLKKAVQKRMQMSLDRRDVVLVAAIARNVRPLARVLVAPRIVSKERDLRRRVSEAQRVVEEEIVQLVGAKRRFGVVAGMSVLRGAGDQLGADWSGENLEQRRTGFAAEVFSLHEPSNYVLDQCLRHARIDAVMRHVIADAVGAPAQCELAQAAGADHRPAAQFRQSKKVAGALARLHVLERDIVNFFAFGIGMPDVFEHLHATRPNVYFIGRAAERL